MIETLLNELSEKINNDSQGIDGLNAVFVFDLSGEHGGVYQIKFQDNQVQYGQHLSDIVHCTLQLSDKNFIKLIKGELNPTTAFMMGKLKIKGDLSLSMKLQSILKRYQ